MYTNINFKTKKQFKEAVANGQKITLFQPGPFGGDKDLSNGTFSVEGPHWPQPHTWYAEVKVENGYVVKVK